MDVFIIAGFLGSGKTSLLLSLAKSLASTGRKVAIIENELGKEGVDGSMLASESLQVREKIYSGCICCSLRLNLSATLMELERECKPDIVFLEPSGVTRQARPSWHWTAMAGRFHPNASPSWWTPPDSTSSRLLTSP